MKYEQQILFLPYLPDQKLAMEFDKVRDKTELVWDFSVKASEKMKQQIFQLLIHILENVKDQRIGEYDSCFLCSGCINIASSKG